MAYGKTGNDASPYLTGVTYSQAYASGYYTTTTEFPMNGTNAFMASATKGSSTLKPEMTSEFEAGVNMQFFKGRFGFDVAYYNRTTSDQIFTLPVDPSTGFYYMVTNFGKVRNQGVELVVNTVPVQTKDFRWELDFNFARTSNKVLSLPESLKVVRSPSTASRQVTMRLYVCRRGKPLGQFTPICRNTQPTDGLSLMPTDNLCLAQP